MGVRAFPRFLGHHGHTWYYRGSVDGVHCTQEGCCVCYTQGDHSVNAGVNVNVNVPKGRLLHTYIHTYNMKYNTMSCLLYRKEERQKKREAFLHPSLW